MKASSPSSNAMSAFAKGWRHVIRSMSIPASHGRPLVSWFSAPVKIMATFTILAAFCLFLPHSIQMVMGLAEWTAKYRVQEWMVFSFGIVWTVISGVQAEFHRSSIKKELHDLPKDKRIILRYYVEQKLSTHWWPASDAAASALELDGILLPLKTHDKTRGHGQFVYVIKPWVRRYLRKRPKLISPD